SPGSAPPPRNGCCSWRIGTRAPMPIKARTWVSSACPCPGRTTAPQASPCCSAWPTPSRTCRPPSAWTSCWWTGRTTAIGATSVGGTPLPDDHLPLQEAGIHAIDVIDFSYGPNNEYWHTTEDMIDKVSAASLQIVGDVAVALVRQ